MRPNLSAARPMLRSLSVASVATLLFACGDGTQDAPIPGWSLELALGAKASVAGDAVPVSMRIVSDAGSEEAIADWTATSDVQGLLRRGADDLTATAAGTHAITVSGTARDATWEGVVDLEVTAGPVHVVDLDLSDHQVPAGADLAWSVQAADRYGNAIDASSVQPDVAGVTVEAGRLHGTVPGIYEATATLEGVSDAETFVIVPADPTLVVLSLDTDLERYDTSHAALYVEDSFGNVLDLPWSLSVDGDGDTVVSGRNVTFRDEGWYTVTATLDDYPMSDAIGPFLIDSSGPTFVIDEPDRGEFVDGYSSTISGTVTDAWSGVSSVEIDGRSVTPDSSGRFSTTGRWDFGMNVLESWAVDGDGNEATDTRALLAGEFLTYGAGAPDGIVVRIHEGTGGFGTLEEIGEDLITATDLDDLIPSPVYKNSSSTCTWLGCITWYSVSLYVTNPSYSSVDLTLDPRSTGAIRSTFVVYGLSLDWSASGKLVGVSYSGSGDITATSLTLSLDLTPSVSSGQLSMGVSNVSASTAGFDFDMDGWLYDVIDFFGVDVDGLIQGYVEGALEDAVEGTLPGGIEDLLQGLELSTDLPIGSRTYTLDAVPGDVSVDGAGLTLAMDTSFTVDSWRSSYTGLGSLYYGYSTPTWTGSPGMLVGLSDDFVNQALYALWGGGLIDQTVQASALGLDVSDLEAFFPGVTDLTVRTEALLPPVAVPTSSGQTELQLGDFHVELFNGSAASGDKLLDAYVSAEMPLDLAVDSAGTALSASLGTPTLYVDVVFPDATSRGAADTEALLEAIVPMLLGSVTDALGELPIPEISGFSLSGVTLSLKGAEYGYVTLGGSLQ